MSQPVCPKCSAALKDDYGMVACPSCGSFVFVDMDGIAHISRDEGVSPAADEPAEAAAEPALLEVFPPQDFSSSDSNGAVELEPPPLDLGLGMQTPHFETPAFSESEAVADEAAPLDFAGEEPPPAGELDMDRLLGFNEPAAEEPQSVAEPEFGAPGDPLGINEYANSEISQAKDGLLTFKILISGIDSKEMRESLRSALDDQRFGWNPNELMSRITKGVLQIDNVASVKAVILINRIKRMPVKVRWEQYAITNMDAN